MAQQSIPTAEKRETAAPRPPVVVVLGHVDHGKSSLLEAIREEFRITSREAGGITQQIGAYEVEVPQGPKSAEAPDAGGLPPKRITFLDTPGHAAFSAMRSRGAKVADIALLVVAADEGVKPQTKEALAHIKEAGLQFIVVASKMDRPEANTDRLKQQLAQEGVLVEGFGGNVPFVQVSAARKQGIQELLEVILLVADMEQFQGSPIAPLAGVVIESQLDAKRGASATVLVRQGTLKKGDVVATTSTTGKVRLVEDFQGNQLQEALPSQPVVVLGWDRVPQVGEEVAAGGEASAILKEPEIPEQVSKEADREEQLPTSSFVLKAGTAGSLEALVSELQKLPQDTTRLVLAHTGVGDIGENDVKLAKGAGARILGFNSKPRPEAASLAERSQVQIETFGIIYELLDRVRLLLEEQEENIPRLEEKGEAEVLAVFSYKRKRQVVGGKVVSGELRKGQQAEILRGGEAVGKGKALNLQRNKEDIASVPAPGEFGMLFESEVRLQAGDTLKVYAK